MKDRVKIRQSNMECVRIIAMTIIVIWHFFFHGGILEYYHEYRCLIPFLIFGVDLFIMISGHYLINVKYASFIRLCVILTTFSIICYTTHVMICDINTIDGSRYLSHVIIAPFSNSDYWFIQVYLGLMALTPILNKALKTMDIKEFRRAMIIFSLCNFYSCWIMNNNIDELGYSIFNFVYIYVLGYYLRVEPMIKKLTEKQIGLIALFCLIANFCLNALIINYKGAWHGPVEVSFLQIASKYSNPLTIILCACIIVGFSQKIFYSPVINSIAGASLGVYLLQDGLLGNDIYQLQCNVIATHNVTDYIILCIVLYFSFWAASWVITQLCNFISKYLTSWLTNVKLRYINGTR